MESLNLQLHKIESLNIHLSTNCFICNKKVIPTKVYCCIDTVNKNIKQIKKRVYCRKCTPL